MINYKVIFDTNSIRNEKLNEFFGSQNKLKAISEYAEIIIPDLVFDEILNQKKKKFNENESNLKSNHLFKLSEFEENKIINIDKKIQELVANINFQFNKIEVENYVECLKFIKSKAISNLSPFEEKSDKGFKDCYIVYTIKEYVDKTGTNNATFIVCSKDQKLKNAIIEISENIIIADNIDDIKSKTIQQYEDDYFIEKLQEELGNKNISNSNIKGLYFNTDYNDILEIVIDKEEYLVHISEREILGYELKESVEKAIQLFEESPSFAETHNRLIKVNDFFDYLGKIYLEKILNAVIKNSQISYIVEDIDIQQFLSDIKAFCEKMIDKELFEKNFDENSEWRDEV